MTDPAIDRHWLLQAVAVGERGSKAVRPNPRVGCVLVRDGVLVGEGWHARVGGPHAEVVALQAAGERARGATAYVTLEPCHHHGRTGPCTAALVAAGVARVVYGVADPNPLAQGGTAWLRAQGLEVTSAGGAQAEQTAAIEACERLAEVFLTVQRHRRPFVQLKLAMTLDGRTAAADGSSRWVTGPAARRAVHQLRAEADAVAVGSGTALADDPALDLRDLPEPLPLPLRIVFDRRLRFTPDLRLADTRAQPTLLATAVSLERGAALAAQGVELLQVTDEPWLPAVLAQLPARGVHHLLCEGGPTLAAALVRAGVVDRLDVFVAPKLLGAGAPLLADLGLQGIGEAQLWRWDDHRAIGDDLWLTARPRRG
jgi:diaminohydroxyphosphoribosylaminopyrimidine deaminase/5-amino-6-(5-phosphoribosylamino)uracil reductase